MLFYLNVKHINVNLLKVFLHIFSNLFICNGIHVDNSKVLIIILITNIVMEIPSFLQMNSHSALMTILQADQVQHCNNWDIDKLLLSKLPKFFITFFP